MNGADPYSGGRSPAARVVLGPPYSRGIPLPEVLELGTLVLARPPVVVAGTIERDDGSRLPEYLDVTMKLHLPNRERGDRGRYWWGGDHDRHHVHPETVVVEGDRFEVRSWTDLHEFELQATVVVHGPHSKRISCRRGDRDVRVALPTWFALRTEARLPEVCREDDFEGHLTNRTTGTVLDVRIVEGTRGGWYLAEAGETTLEVFTRTPHRRVLELDLGHVAPDENRSIPVDLTGLGLRRHEIHIERADGEELSSTGVALAGGPFAPIPFRGRHSSVHVLVTDETDDLVLHHTGMWSQVLHDVRGDRTVILDPARSFPVTYDASIEFPERTFLAAWLEPVNAATPPRSPWDHGRLWDGTGSVPVTGEGPWRLHVVLVEKNALLGRVRTENLVETSPIRYLPEMEPMRLDLEQAAIDAALQRARRAVR